MKRCFLTAVLLAIGLALPAAAQPAGLQLSLDYDGRLYLTVFDFHIDGRVDPTGYGAHVALKSSGILAVFKHFDIRAASQGALQSGMPAPGVFEYVNRDGERVRQVQATWDNSDVRTVSTPAFSNMGDPPASEAQKLASADPVAQLMRIMLTPEGHGPCEGDRPFFDGKQLYGLELTPTGSGALSDRARDLGLTNAVRCTVRYHEIAGFKRKPANKRNQDLNSPISVVFGQFRSGGPWVIASMQADTKLGPARIELRDAHLVGQRP